MMALLASREVSNVTTSNVRDLSGPVNAPVQRRAAQRTVRCNRLLGRSDGMVSPCLSSYLLDRPGSKGAPHYNQLPLHLLLHLHGKTSIAQQFLDLANGI